MPLFVLYLSTRVRLSSREKNVTERRTDFSVSGLRFEAPQTRPAQARHRRRTGCFRFRGNGDVGFPLLQGPRRTRRGAAEVLGAEVLMTPTQRRPPSWLDGGTQNSDDDDPPCTLVLAGAGAGSRCAALLC